MTIALEQAEEVRAPEHRGAPWRQALRRLTRRRWTLVAAVFLSVLALSALFADVIAPHGASEQFLERPAGDLSDPLAPRATGKFEAPSLQHPFGTDQLARDIFSRTLFGLRISLAAAAVAIALTTVLGVGIGTLAATGPRWLDDLLMRATELAFAFPALLLIVLLRSAFGDTLLGRASLLGVDATVLLLFFAIALAAWPTTARLVRGQLLSIRELEHVLAAQALGASRARVVWRHMLPLAMGPVIVEGAFLLPRVIAAEATLSFIGVGVMPPTPSLGVLIRDHFAFVGIEWTALAIPVALLVAMFVAFQVLGDGLRDALDPRTSRSS